MKMIFKLLKVSAKIFTMFTVLAWAWVGLGQLIKRIHEHPEETSTELDRNIVHEAIDNWKMVF